MARFKENDLPKSKNTASSLNKNSYIQICRQSPLEFYVGLFFLLLTELRLWLSLNDGNVD
jgi:hypothetical protein